MSGLTPIAVLGMHRSHTSMVANLLSKCGVYVGPPQAMWEANADNQEGYWEDLRFHSINEEILERFNGSWDLPPAFPENWWKDPSLTDLRERALELARSNDGHSPWAWKDPRTCLTLPFWKDCLGEIRCVVCLRHPVEVARSLANRSQDVLPYEEGLQLWLSYQEAMLRALADLPHIVTHGESYFEDGARELERLCHFLGIEADFKEASAVVNTGLRRSRSIDRDIEESLLPERVQEVYRSLCEKAGPVFEIIKHAAGAALSVEDVVEHARSLEKLLISRAVDLHRARTENKRLQAEVVEMAAGIERLSEMIRGQAEQAEAHERTIRELGERVSTLTAENAERQRIIESLALRRLPRRLIKKLLGRAP